MVTRGFGDLLKIGTQARPFIFELEIEKPEVLYRRVVEVDARMDADGNILRRPSEEEVRAVLQPLLEEGISSLAVVVLHAYRSGALEREVGAVAQAMGFAHVSLSHEIAREIGMVGRGDTTTVDAYLTPLIRDYVATLMAELPGCSLKIMQSSGGLKDAHSFRGKNAILSGPAAGVVAYARVAEQAGFARAIGFDMGGTSTDVSRYEGRFERVYETETAGVRIRAPMMAIHTVAAGGGSLCRYDGYRLTVGPQSAGAVPGPLCYGHPSAETLALTDINLVLGRLRSDRFPFDLAADRSRSALEEVAKSVTLDGRPMNAEAVAEGFFEVANANMAEAIRKVSVARGYDVRDHTLVVFGGAGGQHACAIARRLGMGTILFHPYAGVLSAFGMGLADITWHGEADAGRVTLAPELDGQLESLYATLESKGRVALEEEGFRPEQITLMRRVDLRYRGTETSLTLEHSPGLDRRAAFEAEHQKRFGYCRPGHPIEVVTVRLEAVGEGAQLSAIQSGPDESDEARPSGPTGRLFHRGRWWNEVPVLAREALKPGRDIHGPAVVLEDTGTIVVDPGFTLHARADGCLLLEDREGHHVRAEERSSVADPVRLEIFNNLYMSIAEQMGYVLQRTALSTNIRERLDFSCAVFDGTGGLVANAPHIPVHLGAMSESVRAVVQAHPNLSPGDVFVTNDPANGGSHLPDITVVTPVHDDAGRLLFFTASRGHHADVGGIAPGSMPPFSNTLAEEGVVFRGLQVVRGGHLDEGLLLQTLGEGPFAARAPRDNLADLEAQISANATGARLLKDMVAQYGLDAVAAYMGHVQDNARARVEDALAALPDGALSFSDALDDGTPIAVTLQIDGRRMKIDFTGTGPQVAGNLNAPPAVTMAAVIYVLRALVGSPIPLNGGCLAPVEVVIPEGSVLRPDPDRAVCGGNVETSQRVVDVLLGALGRAAASQGTMNNLTFGDDAFGYYETIAGGAGATRGHPGASGVHTHMTNTRITDPEVLESRFPVRLWAFGLRRGSGGAGRWPGGDGVIREMEFLRRLRVSLLCERRRRAPFGLEGGKPGKPGINLLNDTEIDGKATVVVNGGDRLRIETPGGGGFGSVD